MSLKPCLESLSLSSWLALNMRSCSAAAMEEHRQSRRSSGLDEEGFGRTEAGLHCGKAAGGSHATVLIVSPWPLVRS